MKKTKIVATLGPSTDKPRVLQRLIAAGLDAARLNYSHGAHEEQARRAAEVRRVSARMKREVSLIADLQGPKIRLERFAAGPIELSNGDRFVFDADLAPTAGDSSRVGVTYKDLPRDVKRGDTLLVDDGKLVFDVDHVRGNAVHCTVRVGGRLSNNKGINREGGGLSAKALTAKDRRDLRHAIEVGADYIAISFPRSAADIERARRLVRKHGSRAGIIAKIERAEAVADAEAIINASDGIMIARGDLGVEIGDSRLPPVQKTLIDQARRQHRFTITATQMMDSMIDSPLPTRAEVFDVANAVLDGTDAVMLSGETSVGMYPVETVTAMARICVDAEKEWSPHHADQRLDMAFERVDQAIAMSAIYCANRIDARAIVALTESGATTLWMSRVHTEIPIFALCRVPETRRRVTLYRGVHAIDFDVTHIPYEEVTREVLKLLRKRGVVDLKDQVIITKGDLHGSSGGTNGMKIVEVGNFVKHVG